VRTGVAQSYRRVWRPGFSFRQEKDFSRLRLGSVEIGSGVHPGSCPGGGFMGVKRQKREADQSASGAEVKNAGAMPSLPPIRFRNVMLKK
jgi:hypothetical protein